MSEIVLQIVVGPFTCAGRGDRRFVDADTFVVCSADVGRVLEWTVETGVVVLFGRRFCVRGGEGVEIGSGTGPVIASVEIDVGCDGTVGG